MSLVASMDAYEFLRITLNPDGSLTREIRFPLILATGYNDLTQSNSVASIDIPLNTTKKTWIRVYQPINLPTNTKQLPIIMYFHGGGFIVGSAASEPFHDFCVHMACDLPALVLSVDYRLAPEHRLPSAYEDAVDAMLWLKQEALHGENKFISFVDFTKCFLMGCSAGANIAYVAGLQALEIDLGPVKINGLILNIPFFGGIKRTESELKNISDPLVPWPASDLLWELSLPVGANRDHEYCNVVLDAAKRLEIKMLPRCFVNGFSGDPLVDHEKEFVKMLEKSGVPVVSDFLDGGYHAVELFDPEKARALVMALWEFIYSS